MFSELLSGGNCNYKTKYLFIYGSNEYGILKVFSGSFGAIYLLTYRHIDYRKAGRAFCCWKSTRKFLNIKHK